jgi:hypothetical protein
MVMASMELAARNIDGVYILIKRTGFFNRFNSPRLVYKPHSVGQSSLAIIYLGCTSPYSSSSLPGT